MPLRLILAAFLLGAACLAADMPAPYKKVSHVIWVVSDLDRVTAGWQRAGMPHFTPPAVYEIAGARFGDATASTRLRIASATLGDVMIHWISPQDENNPFTAFLRHHGDGVFSLVHRFDSEAALRAEVARLNALGVATLFEGSYPSGSSSLRFAFMDTLAAGKYSLGLVAAPPVRELPVPPDWRITQFAFIARPLEPVSAFWEKLGLPAMSYTHGPLTDTEYRGKPGSWDARLGWQRHGAVVYEWIEHRRGESTYQDHTAQYGEGFHHFGLNVEDMDRALASWTARGFPVSMSGGWGTKGKPGSGRFAYLDTRELGGVEIELLWNYREARP